MGYSSQDFAALNAARAAGFNPLLRETDDLDRHLDHFHCPDTPLCLDPAGVLAAAIEAACRFDGKTTVWLDVGDRETIPEYVHGAIRSMSGFGASIVVTQAGHCSHGPQAGLLDPKLQEAIYQANGSGYIWHPITDQLVYASRFPRDAAVC